MYKSVKLLRSTGLRIFSVLSKSERKMKDTKSTGSGHGIIISNVRIFLVCSKGFIHVFIKHSRYLLFPISRDLLHLFYVYNIYIYDIHRGARNDRVNSVLNTF